MQVHIVKAELGGVQRFDEVPRIDTPLAGVVRFHVTQLGQDQPGSLGILVGNSG